MAPIRSGASGELADQVGCCSPPAREPLAPEQAVELAKVFKALGDPVRLRLASLIAFHEGGEACACDLTDAFDLSGPTISLRRLSAVLVLDDAAAATA